MELVRVNSNMKETVVEYNCSKAMAKKKCVYIKSESQAHVENNCAKREVVKTRKEEFEELSQHQDVPDRSL